uniref:Major histocompatibility complex class I-related gene protein-like n=1 Tax=Geotrypetes seraphini TaxID=260995 RepID=A0A6P8PXR7_GEOSA|nr:major histocompatibility complex class I-related gene protein-like [Geotrypetes seraphini]
MCNRLGSFERKSFSVFSESGATMALILIFLLVFLSPTYGSSGSHSLRYFYTGISEPGSGAPEFYRIGYVDDMPLTWYDSGTQQFQLLPKWTSKLEEEDPEYKERYTQIVRGWQQGFKVDMRTLMNRYNQSAGVHTLQRMYGCEKNQDGSTWGFHQIAYDGHDFLSFDKDRLTYVTAMPGAEITTQRWNADRSNAERRKAYLEQICIEWLEKYVKYGAKELNNKVRPQVKVSDRKSEERLITLHCQVTGFYPREIDVKWMKNGNIMHGTAAKDILPNHDGTYQTRESVEIDPQEEAKYSCHVEHSSMPESLTVLWEPKSSSLTAIIIGAIAVAVVLIAVVIGVIIWKKRAGKKAGGYSAASAKEDGSSTSSGTSPNPAI